MHLLNACFWIFLLSQKCFAQCPPNYEITPVPSGPPTCRPVLPSLDFYKKNDAFSQGYPVCGAGRIAIGLDFKPLDVSDSSWPKTALSTSSSNPLAPYPYSSPGPGGVDHPIYLYSIPTAKMTRCACTKNNYRRLNPDGVGNLLPDLLITPANPTGARFFTDDYDTIRSQDRSATGPNYSMVAIALDGTSNGNMGDVYASGGSQCACPNVNEKNSAIDGTSVSGSVCKSALDFTDVQTKNYALLTTFIPGVHQTGAYSQVLNPSVEPISSDGSGNIVSTLKLSTSNGGYQQYRRRIWTCAPPTIPQFAGSSQIQCVFPQAQHACDNGSGGGPPSVVSKKWNILPPSTAFDNVVNKKLGCCLNDFNPSDITKSQKFDCVDNSILSKTYLSFDELWTGKDDAADGGQPTALVLSNSSGQIVTGFYGLDGARCGEFSEFGGNKIQSATVNPMLMSSQQNKISESSGVHWNSYNVSPNSQLVTAFLPTRKSIPQTAAEMRRCPILVRAAMIATCPDPVILPKALVTYPAVATAGVATRCAVASTIEIHLRVEQIYEITGLPIMKRVDTFLEGIHPANVDVKKLIKSKTNGSCPAGSILTADGGCTYQ